LVGFKQIKIAFVVVANLQVVIGEIYGFKRQIAIITLPK
jgi:hypothetical protein